MKPQLVPLHVAMAFVGAVHGVQELPHVIGLLFATHAPLQS